MIQFNPAGAVTAAQALKPSVAQTPSATGGSPEFGKLVDKFISNVDSQQQSSDASIKDLLAGKGQDINTVVAEVAKADMSFKLLVGVRNKVIEAYKQTMQMQI